MASHHNHAEFTSCSNTLKVVSAFLDFRRSYRTQMGKGAQMGETVLLATVNALISSRKSRIFECDMNAVQAELFLKELNMGAP